MAAEAAEKPPDEIPEGALVLAHNPFEASGFEGVYRIEGAKGKPWRATLKCLEQQESTE